MDARRYWMKALPYYLRVSFRNSFTLWAAPLALAVVFMLLTGLAKHQWTINWRGVALAGSFGGLIFLLTLFTAIGDDIYRNWGVEERKITWNRMLVWRVFLYLGALFFLTAAFLSYNQGAWLSVFFVLFSIGSAVAAKTCF
jgi:hypothetical protein